MRRFTVLPIGLVLLLAFSTASHGNEPGSERARIRVIASTTDIATIVKSIGGDLVEVDSIIRGYQDPHYAEGKPSYIVKVSRADVLFYIGLQLEIGWLPLLIQGSRNPDLDAVAVSEYIDVFQKPAGEISRQMGGVHPEGNPHFKTDPRNGRPMAQRIAEVLKDHLPPEDRATIDANLLAFLEELDRRVEDWERRLEPYRGLRVVQYHAHFDYLFRWAGWETVAYVEDKPGVPPSPRHLASLENQMKREDIKVLTASSFIDPRIPRRLANRTGAKYVVLPGAVGAEPSFNDWFSFFEEIVSTIEREMPLPEGSD